MTRDYAPKRRTPTKPRSRTAHSTSSSKWSWISLGVLLGLILSGALYWKLKAPTTPIAYLKPPAVAKDSSKKTGKKPSIKPSPLPVEKSAHFDFYTVLPKGSTKSSQQEFAPEREPVDVKAEEEVFSSTPPPEMSPINLATDKSKLSYIIQVGSFQHRAQAETLKAQLALLGYEASLQTFNMGAKGSWFRVYVGPYATKEQALFDQQKLSGSHDLHGLILKIRV